MNRNTPRLLSKTRFAAGLQCHKRLYLESYSPHLRDPIDSGQRAVFETGAAVGRLARERFPGGRLISEAPYQHARAVAVTREAMVHKSVRAIYEAAFSFEDVRIRADILVRRGDRVFDLVEVKSSTGVKDEHIPDVAIQLYVLEGCSVAVRKAYLLHIDDTYVYEGKSYDLSQLFRLEDVTRDARRFLGTSAPDALAAMRHVLRRPTVPDIEIGRHCTRPYRCAFHGYCHRGAPEYHIEQLPWASSRLLEELQGAGIRDIRDIPPEFPGLSPTQRRVRDAVVSGRPWCDPEATSAVAEARHPMHFLDFETFNPALPIYPGTHPYQVIPFQWSLHIELPGGGLRHCAFLQDTGSDPREAFAVSLLDNVKPEGTIAVYSNFEQTILRQLAADLPQFSERLLGLSERMLDLLQVLRKHYYHPAFHGSYSMKVVLPSLAPGLGYDELKIQDGTQASVAFAQMIAPATARPEKERLKKALLAYCKRDTEALVAVFNTLT